MPAGRPRNFDETEVLERAMDLFWQRGYRGLGLADLLAHMGISRQSLYDTFGSKRGLFLRTVEHYRSTYLARALDLLQDPEVPPLDRVRALLDFFEELAADRRCRGCLVANTIVELGSEDAEIAELLRETLALVEEGLYRALAEARRRGELPRAKSPRELARALTNAMIGMAVSGRLPLAGSELRSIHAGTLHMLD